MKRQFKIYDIKIYDIRIYDIKIFDENVRTKQYKKPGEKFIYGKK